MEKVLIADFSNGKDRVTARGLWQFDRGVKLKVIGINVADVNRVDFASVIASDSVPVVVVPDGDGTFTVSIPGAVTKSSYGVTAYIYVDTADYGYTVKAVNMPVTLRQEAWKPGEEEKPDPFGEAVEKVSGYAKEARYFAKAAAESEKAASESAAQAEKAKEASVESAEKAAESKEAAATSAMAAAESERQAMESAATAHSAADQAAKSATAAAESETAATQQATNATQSATNASGSAESANQSAQTAKTAADTAGKSASDAQQASRSAAESASTATAAAQTATTAAGKAAESATSASQSAETAGQKATAAETAAGKAAESATAARESATAAGASATAAKESETAATASAVTATEQAEKIKASAEQIEKNKTDVASLKEDLVQCSQSISSAPKITWITNKFVNGLTGEIGNISTFDIAEFYVDDLLNIKGTAYFHNDAGYAFYDKNNEYISGENNTVFATHKFELNVEIPDNAFIMRVSHRNDRGYTLDVTGQIKYVGDLFDREREYNNTEFEKINKKFNNTKNSKDIVKRETLTAVETISVQAPNTKNGNVISFYANISSMSTLKIGHGTSAYASSSLRIKNNIVEVHRQDSTDVLVQTYTHGLSFEEFISVVIITNNNNTASVLLTSENGVYRMDSVEWIGSAENVYATAVSGTYNNCELSYYCKDIYKPVWIFGDSYMSQWNVYADEFGAKNWLNDSYPGRNSSENQAIASLTKDIRKGKPKIIVWAMGMNDQENYSWGLTQWMNGYNTVKSICEENGIELILVTIPNTPTMKNTGKNAIIKESGFRYVDIADLVGASEENSSWYDGLLSGDKVHPTELGRKIIALKMMSDIPEMI